MIKRITSLIIMTLLVAGCSGSIYRQRPIPGVEPVAITLDARQRVLLSQIDPDSSVKQDSLFRRFCAEPSPDVFTVLGVSASGSGSLGLGADKSVNAALQAAFASSETGATIARTQTVNMLREMMFNTCVRYLNGAISREAFPIIAARDQRIMVSILAIEQLTGAVTPRTLAVSAGGNSSTGMDPTAMVKLLAEAQGNVDAADEDVQAKIKKVAEADAAAATCTTIRKKKADEAAALTADETTKLGACDKADADLAAAKTKRDVLQARYDDLVAASKRGNGVSSAATSTSVSFDADSSHAAAVTTVAEVVGGIVDRTFHQDETQLFCIQKLFAGKHDPEEAPLLEQCRSYLMMRVQAEEKSLSEEYGLPQAETQRNFAIGVNNRERRQLASYRLSICVADAEKAAAIRSELTRKPGMASYADPLIEAGKRSSDAVRAYLFDRDSVVQDALITTITSVCDAGGD